MTKHFLVVLLILSGLAWPVLGQDETRFSGRFFVTPGVVNTDNDSQFVLHLGSGAEVLVHEGFGLTADLGYLFDPGSLEAGSASSLPA